MSGKAQQDQKLPLKLRLKAWWEGYDPHELKTRLDELGGLEDEPAPDTEADAAPPDEVVVRDPLPADVEEDDLPFDPWDDRRAEVAQYIWGEGYCGPGGPEHIIAMSKLLALSPEMSMLEIGAGLGGPTRTLAEHFGVWMTGYEESASLVELANEKATMAGMGKKAEVHPFDPENVADFDRKFDRAFAKEAMFTVADKAQLITRIEQHLKPGGLFLATDYVLGTDSVVGTEDYRKWKESERKRPAPVTADELAELFKSAHLLVRVDEDVSDDYISVINKAWAGADKVAARLSDQPDGPELIQALMREAELWAHRSRMLKEGHLRVWRILAAKKSDGPSMMSDW